MGCLPGDTPAPHQFSEAYNKALRKWDQAIRSGHYGKVPLPLTMHHWTTGEAADPTMTVLADDVARTGFCVDYKDFARQAEMWENTLNYQLEKIGIGQNKDKKKVLLALPSDGLFPNLSRLVVSQFEYVGSVFSCNDFGKSELSVRVEKAKRAWASMGKFWSKPAPEKFKLTCYRALVLNALLSGLEALVPSEKDMRTLEFFQLKCLRRIMCGGACFKILRQAADGSQYVQFRALTNSAVRESLRVPTIASELRARRIRWLQNMCRWKTAGAITLHILESRFLWEHDDQIASNGRLTNLSSPWVVQFYRDIKIASEYCPRFQEQFILLGWWSIYTNAFQHVKSRSLLVYDDDNTVNIDRHDYAQVFDVQGSHACSAKLEWQRS